MRKEPQTFLECYNLWVKNAYTMPGGGICKSLPLHLKNSKAFGLIVPDVDEKFALFLDDKDEVYWGSDSWWSKSNQFTPLRQTIILLAAALNDEL